MNPNRVVVLLSVEGIFALLFSWIQLGEELNVVKVCGAFMIVAAVILTQLFAGLGKQHLLVNRNVVSQ